MPGDPPPSIAVLRLFYLALFIALGVYLPLLPVWLEARGVEGVAMGAVMATLPAMSVVAPPAFGALADAFGLRGRMLQIVCAGAFLVFGFVAVAARLDVALGPAGLFAAMLAFAFFRAPMIPMSDVVALETVRRLGLPYGQVRLWGSLGFALAVTAAGAWLDTSRYAPLPIAMTVALLVTLATSLSLPARAPALPRPVPEHIRALLRSTDFRLFLGASLIGQAAHSAYDLCFSLHLRDLGVPPALRGVAWAIGVAAEIALMACSGPILARAQPAALLAIAFAGSSLRWALLASVRSHPVLLSLQPLHAASFALMWIASLGYLQGRAPPHVLATAQGLFTASASSGSVIGMLAWGPLYRRAGGAATFGAASVIAALACVLAVVFSRVALAQTKGTYRARADFYPRADEPG